jgi:hypothetical protein
MWQKRCRGVDPHAFRLPFWVRWDGAGHGAWAKGGRNTSGRFLVISARDRNGADAPDQANDTPIHASKAGKE